MKAITIVNCGRLALYGPVLDLLVSRRVIDSWYGISLWNRKDILDSRTHKYLDKILFVEGDCFKDRHAANHYLNSLSFKYNCFEFGAILAAEKYVHKYFPRGLVDMASIIRFVEDSIVTQNADILISDFPASSMDMTAYYICKSKNIPTVFLGLARIRNRNFFCYEPEKGEKEYISYHYYHYKKNGIPEQERKSALEFLMLFKETKYKPVCMNLDVSFGWKLPKEGIARRMISVCSNLIKKPSTQLSRFKGQINKFFLKREWESIFDALDERDRIIFFPVQYQPEASSSVRGPFFKNQYALIENLSIAIPAGYTLYVKEHPQHLSRLSLSFLKEVKKELPNLKFLDLKIDSHDIIKKSKMVAVLSSSAGWEAFLYGVPVLAFGSAFYNQFKGVYRFQGYGSLRTQIQEIIDRHRSDEEEILRAVAASFGGTLPGYIDDPKLYPHVLEEDNIAKIADLAVRGIEFYPRWRTIKDGDHVPGILSHECHDAV